MSLSARRAWIEIRRRTYQPNAKRVALRKESVDRNEHAEPTEQAKSVALRKESVDRNRLFASSGVDFAVALRKESVDRNDRLRY